MPVKHIVQVSEMEKLVKESTSLIVIDFSATWCGPCQRIGPIFEQLSGKYSDVVFVKIDVDEAAEIAEGYDVSCMPTFLFLKNGKEACKRLEGADPNALESNINKYK